MRRERGVSMLFVAVVLIAVAAAALAFLALTRTTAGVDRSTETGTRLARISAALEQFAGVSERLPCPANPATDTGDAEPNAPAAACAFPNGTVPWRTIGLRREDALDAWGFKISYRVFSGATGLTQAGGASMVHCDTVEPANLGVDPATGKCRASHDTLANDFLVGKGLALNDFGAAITDAAYVLISHGPSGLAGYTSAGVQKAPNPASAAESANAASGPFVARAASTGVSPEDAAHFDDVLAYRRLADFVSRSNLAARDWPEGALADITLDTPTLTTALGSTPSYGDLGTTTLNLGAATLTTFNGGGNENISFQSVNGVEGIGGTVGTPGISSDSSEGVRILFGLKARQLAVTLNQFGRLTGGGPPREDRAEFRFFDGATQVHSVIKTACRVEGGLASFSIDALADFDRVEIRALPTTEATTTEFYLAQFKTCAGAMTCETSLSTPSNSCS